MPSLLERAHARVLELRKNREYHAAMQIASREFGVTMSDLGKIGAEHRKAKYGQSANGRRNHVRPTPPPQPAPAPVEEPAPSQGLLFDISQSALASGR